jgi:cysteine desulfurase family protein (TIGR01976 family)
MLGAKDDLCRRRTKLGAVRSQDGASISMTRTARTAADLDVKAVREHFPALHDGAAHFDGPGGTQTPDVVADAVRSTLVGPLANRGVTTIAERNADNAVHECRAALADFLGVTADTVVFGRSMTSLTFEMSRTLSASWKPGDEVIVTRLDHDANVRPWVVAARQTGASVRWADFEPSSGELATEAIDSLLTDRTKLVAVTAASNLIGTIPDIPAIAERVHRAGALLYVDGVSYSAHAPVDVPALGADVYVCSPYKFFGPHCGVLTGKADLLAALDPDKVLPSPHRVPERFELGTLPYELMAGAAAAIDFLADTLPAEGSRRERLIASIRAIEEHEAALCQIIEVELSRLPGVTLYSRARRRTPTLLVTFAGHRSADVATFLAEQGVNAPAGSFYAYETSRRLGLGEAGGVRIGLAMYNDETDVDRLLDSLSAYLGTRHVRGCL